MDEPVYLDRVQDLFLKEGLGKPVQRAHVGLEELFRLGVVLDDYLLYPFVYLFSLLLSEVPPLSHLLAEEYMLFLLAEGNGPELVAHAPLADHLARELRGPLYVVARARGDAVQGQLR